MRIIDDDIWFVVRVVDDPQASGALSNDFSIIHGTLHVAVTQKTKTEEWIGHPFGEEDSTNAGRDSGKGITHTTNHQVLEQTSISTERRLLVSDGKVSFPNKLIW